jgi:RNA polymerase sigma-70 factor (ECF subfamily)
VPQPEVTSCTLLDQAGSRDDSAWQRLVSLYTPLVQHWCRRAGVTPADVQDVAQDVFVSLSVSLVDFHPERTGSFRKWVRGIARHKALDHFRRRRGEQAAVGGTIAHGLIESLPEQDDDPDTDADEAGGLYRRALTLIQGQFEDRTWQAFWRTAVDGHPTNVVAGELGLTPVAVRIAKSRVLARLRADLGELIK